MYMQFDKSSHYVLIIFLWKKVSNWQNISCQHRSTVFFCNYVSKKCLAHCLENCQTKTVKVTISHYHNNICFESFEHAKL